MTDITTVSDEELAAEQARRNRELQFSSLTAEQASLAPYKAAGFSTESVDELIGFLKSNQDASSPYFAYHQAAITGLEGIQITIGNRIKYVDNQLAALAAETE